MKTEESSHYPVSEHHFKSSEWEEHYYDSLLCYSFRHLMFIDNVSQFDVLDALQKSIHLCYLAGINSKHHFKQIYVYDANISALHIDWLMSKKGFNLMVMQIPSQNQRLARWLWQLANL